MPIGYNSEMLVFIDESGDPGMKLSEGSSAFFVITAVMFEDREEANICDAWINEIRTDLGLSPRYEFHFAKSSSRIRNRFLELVAPFDFFYFSVVVDKAKLRNPGFQKKESLIKYASGLLFESAKPRLKEAIVIIDASGSRDFRNALAVYLKKRVRNDGGYPIIKKVKSARSESNNLVQLVDMVSGAVWRSFTRNDASYRSLVAARELAVDVWPR